MTVRPCAPAECAAVLDLWRQAEATPSATDSLAELTRLLGEPQGLLRAGLSEIR
jgi:hypothetical protein